MMNNSDFCNYSKGSSPEPRVESPPEQTPDVVEEALVVFPVNQPEEAVEDVGAEANGAAGPDPLPTTVVDCQATGWALNFVFGNHKWSS